ncbi:GNAT family N-acetyltransferase [Hydrogenophaga laconesensis]|uniref:GNAT superfamily N-acetyltransferase n=1 Tax=Hydrogenophaga laconesensis TaxID=1805971 RepID=A0ABU1V539_9BURK|nr:GNAT family N-acetyltransferase [Hydrogenophaga laconesensis]MDR7092576.1 GNAT superfamily N-acetyltransferase [Hydrogenophaga laconesensis]
MNADIRPGTAADHPALLAIWLEAVRATHTFLSEADVQSLLPVVRDKALPHLQLWVLCDGQGAPAGFMGMSGAFVEALFIAPRWFRQGGGRQLLAHARGLHGALSVDVNEQNPEALAFYRANGFQIVGRSPLDGEGRPFPLVHLRERHATVRRFRAGDEAALHAVHHGAIHRTASRDYTPEQLNAWSPADHDARAWARRMQDIRPFVAEVDGAIAGYADMQPSGYIDHFFVSPDFARQGVGSLLMRQIHEEAARQGIDELTSDVSLTAQPFFARNGFEIAEQRFPVRAGVTIPNALMRKTIRPSLPA